MGREGDWECSSCGNKNYAFRCFCNRCKQPRLLVDYKTPHDSKWFPRIGDWICTVCGQEDKGTFVHSLTKPKLQSASKKGKNQQKRNCSPGGRFARMHSQERQTGHASFSSSSIGFLIEHRRLGDGDKQGQIEHEGEDTYILGNARVEPGHIFTQHGHWTRHLQQYKRSEENGGMKGWDRVSLPLIADSHRLKKAQMKTVGHPEEEEK